ncbi:11051_t:CDS:1, partial [Ambispora leptoticha]
EQLLLEEFMIAVCEYINLKEETYNIIDYTEKQDSCMMREIIVTIQEYSKEGEEKKKEKLEK